MIKKIKMVVLFLAITLLFGCHRLSKGTVVDKYTKPSYTTFVYVNKGLFPQVHPEQYLIEIKGEVDGERLVETFSLDKSEWKKIKIGDVYEVKDD
ncbi:hypothetical protein [Streptococcus pluranimalium]|uniref:hypothetical protein n=1 Tax=Streptococcus pluranimalium TaxID=82348 RepID=UPI003F67FD38